MTGLRAGMERKSLLNKNRRFRKVIKMDSVKLLTIILIVSLIILLAGVSVWAFQLQGGLSAPIAAMSAA